MSNTDTRSQVSKAESSEEAKQNQSLQRIHDALRGLRYGSVTIIVQDGLVIQIDRLEKFRIRSSRE